MIPDDFEVLRDHLKHYADINGLEDIKAAALLFDSFLGNIDSPDEPENDRIFPPDEEWYFQ